MRRIATRQGRSARNQSPRHKIDTIDSVDNIDIIDYSPRPAQVHRLGASAGGAHRLWCAVRRAATPLCPPIRRFRPPAARQGRRALPLVATGWRPRQAFTLIELLIVISIISILLGMLISTVRAVRRYSRQTITRGELKNIEAAWKQFYAHYQYWPDAESNIDRFWAQTGDDAKNDARFEMMAPLARMLEGEKVTPTGDPTITTYNADTIAFLELSRFNADGDPVNAWGRDRTIPVPGKEKPNTYVVVFDSDGDNEITVELPGVGSTNLFRSVVVWTENPEYAEPKAKDKDAPKGPQPYFGSWME